MTARPPVRFALLHLLSPVRPFIRKSAVCCIFALATVVVLFASSYKAAVVDGGNAHEFEACLGDHGARNTLDP
jgi:hypothetical protein